ncbi:hypothetical protein C2E23DRAFT_890152 [Lenzites betulinus]|nr:hypothetical protein C2E23DRAFT_890152 [Lenzites betulinus]
MCGTYVTGLLSLDDDVLHCIFSHLYGEDALNVSLTAHRAHDLAIRRVAAVAVCRKRKEVLSLRRYMLYGSPPRAQYLEKLIVWVYAYNPPEETAFIECREHDWAQLRLIVDVLAHAPNLREVVLPFLYPSLERDSRLGDVLCAMQHLTTATFEAVEETTMAVMHRWSRRLECLQLKFHIKGAQPYFPFRAESNPITYPSLLRNLAAFTALHTLCLRLLRTRPSSPSIPDILREPTDSYYYLSSLCNLDLWTVEPRALDIVQLCPRLTSLCYSLISSSDDGEDSDEADNPATGARWPSLRCLRVDTLKDAAHARHILGHVDYLHICSDIDIRPTHTHEEAMLLAVVERTSPVGMRFALTFHCTAGHDGEAQLWARLAARAPKLRVLEVKLAYGGEYAVDPFSTWLHALPDIFSPLGPALRSLRLIVYRQRRRHPQSLRKFLNPYHSRPPYVDPIDEKAVLEHSSPHGQLVAALRALNCLELWEAGETRKKIDRRGDSYCGANAHDVADTGSYSDHILRLRLVEDDDEVPVYGRWENWHGRAVYYRALYRRWWRVRRGSEQEVGGGPALENIDRMEAMRMHAYLRDTDDVSVARFDGKRLVIAVNVAWPLLVLNTASEFFP